ncbi:hypothetical protein IPH92_01095 [Candidatus Kaiserbacteria bacterium]|nr:MAG: hypothetical protein IPH92_01095 [Candidatus Kaiserbacteria bacterium]
MKNLVQIILLTAIIFGVILIYFIFTKDTQTEITVTPNTQQNFSGQDDSNETTSEKVVEKLPMDEPIVQTRESTITKEQNRTEAVSTSTIVTDETVQNSISKKVVTELPMDKPVVQKKESTISKEQNETEAISTSTIIFDETVQNSINELVISERQLGSNITVGYIWRAFDGSPKFNSVRIPIWDISALGKEYQVDIWDGDSFVFYKNAKPLVDEVIFPKGGASQFRVSGIDPSFGICPAEHSRFTWGVTFTADGIFKGERVPITIDGAKKDMSCNVVH